MSQEAKIAIIGAGVTGIIMARSLQDQGISFDWYEESSDVGGLLATDLHNGFALDHGFQVIQTGYEVLLPLFKQPPFNRYKTYAQGAWIFDSKGRSLLSHPKEGVSATLKTLFNRHLSVGDKAKMLLLQRWVLSQSDEELMNNQRLQQPTDSFLNRFGFTDSAIQSFFKPWFSGVFLEGNLQSSAALFCLFFKAFARGGAALPPGGIQQFARDLASPVSNQGRYFGQRAQVEKKEGNWVVNGRSYSKLVWACGSASPGEASKSYRLSETLYYSAKSDASLGRYLALNASESSLVQTFSVPSNVEPSYAPSGQCLWSVQLKPESAGSAEHAVWGEVQTLLGETLSSEFLGRYTVSRSLPLLSALKHGSSAHQFDDGSYTAGPHCGYPSLQSAWESAEDWVRNWS
ncbi:MAG: FAD-dependent oxidoreductase [Bacteroidia bacterium]